MSPVFEYVLTPLEFHVLWAIPAESREVRIGLRHRSYFRAGDIIKVDSELMKIEGMNRARLLVERGYAGTTAADHLPRSPLTIVGVTFEGQEHMGMTAMTSSKRKVKGG